MEFAEITEDPFTNNTSNFFLVLDIGNHPVPNPSSVVGVDISFGGKLLDSNGNNAGYFWLAITQDYEVTGSLSDESYAHSFTSRRNWMLVPPKYSLEDHVTATGFWLSYKEVEQFILGRLSLIGGD